MYYLEQTESYRVDILFVGTWEKERDDLLTYLYNCGYKVIVKGSFWKESKFMRCSGQNVERTRSTREYRLLLSSSKISLNFFREQNSDKINSRLIEILACGGICLTQSNSYLKKVFGKQKGLYYFSDRNSLMRQISILIGMNKEQRWKSRIEATELTKRMKLSHTELWGKYLDFTI